MSKELNEAWTTICHYNDEIIHDLGSEYVENPLNEEINIVNNALLELKAIKETKPSKVLDLFNHWKINTENGVVYIPEFVVDKIEHALIKAQEQEKVLKVILKKQVDINEIKILISNLKHCDDIERCKRYNVSRKVGYKLKQDEFNSIKEMLNNEITRQK